MSLQVSEEGDVLYVFPKDYRSKLGAKSFRIKAEPFIEKAKVLKIVVVDGVLFVACGVLAYCTTFTLTGRGRVLDKGFFWDSTHCIDCYCLHCNNCSCN